MHCESSVCVVEGVIPSGHFISVPNPFSPSAKSQNRSPSLHPLCEKLSFTEGLGWVIPSTETSVGRCKGGSFCQNDEVTCDRKTVQVSMATNNSSRQLTHLGEVSVHVGLREKLTVLRKCSFSLLLEKRELCQVLSAFDVLLDLQPSTSSRSRRAVL